MIGVPVVRVTRPALMKPQPLQVTPDGLAIITWALPGHFKIAEKLAGVGGDDFIKDDARGASRQPGVALYPAAELGLDVGAAVVENGALGGNVKLAVGVARNPGSTGGLDVDQWDAVAGLQHSRLLAAGSGFVGDDLGVGRATQSTIPKAAITVKAIGRRVAMSEAARPVVSPVLPADLPSLTAVSATAISWPRFWLKMIR